MEIFHLDADERRLRRERSVERLSGYKTENYLCVSVKICVPI